MTPDKLYDILTTKFQPRLACLEVLKYGNFVKLFSIFMKYRFGLLFTFQYLLNTVRRLKIYIHSCTAYTL